MPDPVPVKPCLTTGLAGPRHSWLTGRTTHHSGPGHPDDPSRDVPCQPGPTAHTLPSPTIHAHPTIHARPSRSSPTRRSMPTNHDQTGPALSLPARPDMPAHADKPGPALTGQTDKPGQAPPGRPTRHSPPGLSGPCRPRHAVPNPPTRVCDIPAPPVPARPGRDAPARPNPAQVRPTPRTCPARRPIPDRTLPTGHPCPAHLNSPHQTTAPSRHAVPSQPARRTHTRRTHPRLAAPNPALTCPLVSLCIELYRACTSPVHLGRKASP